jgi:hypothetical protein
MVELVSVAKSAPANEDDSATRTARRRAAEEARIQAEATRHWTGDKYDRERPMAEIASATRAALKALVRDESSPLHGCTFSLRSSGTSTSRTLRIVITGLPSGLVVLSTRRIRQDMGLVAAAPLASILSPAGASILDAAKAVADAYNYNRGGGDVNFFLHVDYSDAIMEGHRAEIRRAFGGPTAD